MRKVVVLLAAVVALVGCGDTYDQEGFDQVSRWANESIGPAQAAAMTAVAYAEGQADREELASHTEELERIFDAAEQLPAEQEIESWGINMSRGDRDDPHTEWVIEGEELADAVNDLHAAVGYLADDIDAVLDAGAGKRDERIRTMVGTAEDVYSSADELGEIVGGP